MVIDIVAIVLSSLVILCSIIVAAWRCGKVIGQLTEEVRGHNKRLDDLTSELKTHIKNNELRRTRRRE